MINKSLLKLELDGTNTEHIVLVCKAFADKIRLEVLYRLAKGPASVTELAGFFRVPLSTMSGHIHLLEQAGLISLTPIPGSRGSKKTCNILVERLELDLIGEMPELNFSNYLFCYDMPVGNYFDFNVSHPCGLASAEGFLAEDDNPAGFALPSHGNAQMLWFGTGYLEYRFDLKNAKEIYNMERLEFSLEICAEAYGYNESWCSDVSVWMNDVVVGTMECKGDHGGRPGKQNPPWWPEYATQFGDLHRVILSTEGVAVDGIWSDALTLKDVLENEKGLLHFKIGVEETAHYVGGLNLFGNLFGDYSQGILMEAYGENKIVK